MQTRDNSNKQLCKISWHSQRGKTQSHSESLVQVPSTILFSWTTSALILRIISWQPRIRGLEIMMHYQLHSEKCACRLDMKKHVEVFCARLLTFNRLIPWEKESDGSVLSNPDGPLTDGHVPWQAAMSFFRTSVQFLQGLPLLLSPVMSKFRLARLEWPFSLLTRCPNQTNR